MIDDMSLDPSREPQHRARDTGAVSTRKNKEQEKDPKPMGMGVRKPRYYQPDQLDLVTRYWNGVVKPVDPWGG